MKTNVILDISNILYRNFHGMKGSKFDIIVSAAHMAAFTSLNYYHREYAADEMVIAFDGRRNWRKIYTSKDPDCLTHKKYKGNRRKGLTKAELAKLERFDEHVVEFRDILREQTGLLVLHHEYLEADDVIAAYIQKRPDEKHLIVSADRDYLQLMRQPNVFILDPATKKNLTLDEYNDDADFFMFRKCIRGDSGDNVISSYPRIREDKIKLAYTDDYHLNNLLKNEFEVEYVCEETGDVKKKKYKTEEVFLENEMLMDLSRQPPGIRKMMFKAVDDCVAKRGKYNMFNFLRFCGKNDLQFMIQDISKYASLLKGGRQGSGG